MGNRQSIPKTVEEDESKVKKKRMKYMFSHMRPFQLHLEKEKEYKIRLQTEQTKEITNKLTVLTQENPQFKTEVNEESQKIEEEENEEKRLRAKPKKKEESEEAKIEEESVGEPIPEEPYVFEEPEDTALKVAELDNPEFYDIESVHSEEFENIPPEEIQEDLEETRANDIKLEKISTKIFEAQSEDVPFEVKKEVLHKEMNLMGKIIKKKIVQDKVLHPEKFIEPEEALQREDLRPVGILANFLEEKVGIKTAIERKPENEVVSDACLQFLFNGMGNVTKLDLSFEFGEKRNKELLENKEEQNKFFNELKGKLAKDLDCSKNQIKIINPRQGCFEITTILETIDYNKDNHPKFKNILKGIKGLKKVQDSPLLDALFLSASMFDPRGNGDDSTWAPPGETRAGIEYFPPYGWTGYGLKVKGKYKLNGIPNDDWLAHDGRKGEWMIAYHGVSSAGKKLDNGRTKAENIIKENFIKGHRHEFYENGINHDDFPGLIEYDKLHPNNICKHGPYFTPFVKYSQYFSQDGAFSCKGKKYMLTFMCRINPKKAQIRQLCNAEWICSGTTDEVRPYRILIKEYNPNEEITWEDMKILRKKSIYIPQDVIKKNN